MLALFHRMNGLSMRRRLAVLGVAAAAAGAGFAGFAQQQPAGPSPYPGRWTVASTDGPDEAPVSERGLVYHTFDIAPCGKDLCAVSVSAAGACGAMLFRIPAKKAANFDYLEGRALWGKKQKNLAIFMEHGEAPDENSFELYIGDGHDFGGRSDNIPKYYAYYTPAGPARCVATPS